MAAGSGRRSKSSEGLRTELPSPANHPVPIARGGLRMRTPEVTRAGVESEHEFQLGAARTRGKKGDANLEWWTLHRECRRWQGPIL